MDEEKAPVDEPAPDPTRWAETKEPMNEAALAAAAEVTFLRSPERAALLAVAGRARLFAVAAGIVAFLEITSGIVGIVKKADATVAYMVLAAGLNVALCVFLLRMSKAIKTARQVPEAPIVDGFAFLSKAFVVQLVATGIVALGLIGSLLLALMSNRALNQ
jgi:hypothetical protein